MFWADEVAQQLKKRNLPLEWVDDMKTPSGRVHVGALLGVVFHDLVYRALRDLGVEAKYTYVFENHDPMDDIPTYLPREKYEQYLGMPLYKIPSPVEGYKDFAEYYAMEFKKAFNAIGSHPEILWTKDLYTSGKMNKGIKLVLDNAEEIRSIYREMYKKDIPSDWYPFQVYCEKCGKVSTTRVYSWDGEKVHYRCLIDATDWTKGCGHEGSVSPFSDENHFAGKMPWKVEWSAKWQAIGVTVEGAGKDHMSRGGSHDLTSLVAERVLKYPVPYPIGYEFMLIGGKKMSSSKGRGFAASDLVEILPPELIRFLIVKMDIKKQSDFDPTDPLVIPRLFDEYQKYAECYRSKSDPDMARIFELSQISDEIKLPSSRRFSVLTQWVQMPNMQERIKEEGLEEWAKYARIWVDRFAPDSEKFVISEETLPESVTSLTESQKAYLRTIPSLMHDGISAEDFQVAIYNLAKDQGLPAKEAFAAIYTAFLGKDHGPRAAWLLLSLEKSFVTKRLFEAADASGEIKSEGANSSTSETGTISPEVFSIAPEIYTSYPSVSVGIATIHGVTVRKSLPELEREKEEVLMSLKGLTTETLGTYPEVQSYRRLYKAMGIDWHSRRPSPEALLRRVALQKGLYTINTCVDAYNLVVMKHRVSVGAFDLDEISFPTVLRFPKPGEDILLLGDTEATRYKETEIAYFDQKGGYNIDFNFRDAKRTAVTEKTTNVYINVDGIFDVTPSRVEQVLREACDSIINYCGGTVDTFGVLSQTTVNK